MPNIIFNNCFYKNCILTRKYKITCAETIFLFVLSRKRTDLLVFIKGFVIRNFFNNLYM